jgi:two-component system, chemotaxis family, chemotaxis protein CheY
MSKLNVPVLVVDDQALMRKIVRKLLSHIGFTRITDVADGDEALAALRTAPHGLVISDWNMDKMSGIELLAAIRADATLKNLPFILATAEGKPEHVLAAKEAGANGYIVKPFDVDSLKSKIESVLGVL